MSSQKSAGGTHGFDGWASLSLDASNYRKQFLSCFKRNNPPLGKSIADVDISTEKRGPLLLRDILEGETFNNSRTRMPLAIGTDVDSKQEVILDLVNMPNLLVGGAPGMGVTDLVHAMVLSLLYTFNPRDFRMVMIDSKARELSVYNDVHHLLLPVMGSQKASYTVDALVHEIEKRSALFASEGVRSLEAYNERVVKEKRYQSYLPNILFLVSELAELKLRPNHELEEALAYIGPIGRGAGLHMILATQNPAPSVVTGMLAANMPGRIAFRVNSKQESQTILGKKGAELIGGGEMLYLSPLAIKPKLIHAPLISDHDIKKAADFLKGLGAPEYELSFLRAGQSMAPDL